MIQQMFLNYSQFEHAKGQCRECPVGLVYNRVVLSLGNKVNPKVVLIGEAPGAEEVLQGEPFCGRSGKLLRSVINSLGFTRENTLITNIIPCRPSGNQFPKDDELVASCCTKWLKQELRLLNPDFIGLIGSNALRFVLGLQGITRYRGQWHLLPDCHREIHVISTFHPSFVLRAQNMDHPAPALFRSDLKILALQAGFIRE